METAASKLLRLKFLRTLERHSGSTLNELVTPLLADVQSTAHLVTPSGSDIFEVHETAWVDMRGRMREYEVFTEDAPEEEEV